MSPLKETKNWDDLTDVTKRWFADEGAQDTVDLYARALLAIHMRHFCHCYGRRPRTTAPQQNARPPLEHFM